MTTTADRPLGVEISRALKARGVDVIFGIPGVHNIELYRGIEEAGLTHVLARHEQGAGFMADGYARATGRVGVAFVITGPGLCNIMTPMGQAASDSVPLLVISSCLEREHRHMGRGRLHEMGDQEAAAAAVCDWSLSAPDAEAAWQLIDRALAECACRRPGPKHLQLPIDVLGAPAAPAPPPPALPARPRVAEAALDALAARLAAARRPLFIFGGGAVAGWRAARALQEATGAACFCTYAGNGVIAPEQALNFGPLLGRPGSARIIASADLVVAVGTRLAEVDLWRDRLGHRGALARIDIDPEVLADWHRADLPLLGDAPDALSRLAARGWEAPAGGWDAAEVAAARRAFLAESDAARPGIVPLVRTMQAALPEDTIHYSDMTQFAYVAKEVAALARPGLWHHPTGFGTLGYGLPAAIGGKIGRPEVPVVAITGDYGFHYTMQELGVAVELGLNLPILLWDNGKLGEIEDSMTGAQIAPNAVVARNPDFLKLAEAFGAAACQPDSLDGLGTALRRALRRDRPTLIRMTPALV